MNKFSTGLMVGGILGLAGLAAMLSNKKNHSKLLNKTSDIITDVTNSF